MSQLYEQQGLEGGVRAGMGCAASAGRMSECRLLIDGEWIEGSGTLEVLDKYTQEPCGLIHLPSREQIAEAVHSAAQAFGRHEMSAFERGEILDNAVDHLELRRAELMEALVREAGFVQQDAANEIKRCMQTLRLSAVEARALTGEMVPLDGSSGQRNRVGFTIRVPLGVVCAITPFNAPLNTVAHKLAPALAAGNAVVLKPSTHAPTPARILVEALLDAGLPPRMVQLIHGAAQEADWLLNEQDIAFYAFTGSTDVGRKIQQRVGLRRTQMELGSIAFTIVCEDADLDQALPRIVNASFRKAGQVCTSVQRLLVHESIRERVESRLVPLVERLSYGDPSAPQTVVGPVISIMAAERIESWIREAIDRGGRLLVGGARHGAVVSPTLLADVDPGCSVCCREVFGPVLVLETFKSMDEAIARVNGTPFGLAAGLFTNRLDDAFHAIRRLQVGGVHVNETSNSRVDSMPYGGTKNSGFGREGPRYAIREMSEERMVSILV